VQWAGRGWSATHKASEKSMLDIGIGSCLGTQIRKAEDLKVVPVCRMRLEDLNSERVRVGREVVKRLMKLEDPFRKRYVTDEPLHRRGQGISDRGAGSAFPSLAYE
jgi:hypothetical protein